VNLWRVVPLDRTAGVNQAGGALWIPRALQGVGRHDNPELYGCLYVSETPVSAIAEHLAPFRGTGRLLSSMLMKFGLPLALVELHLPDEAALIDFDDPDVLKENDLRPSQLATRIRETTQADAQKLSREHPEAAGIRWWSTLEPSWINVSIFDRAVEALTLGDEVVLDTGNGHVRESADYLGLTLSSS